ncbi:MAG TPA: trypsin-like peptidase domain-containing protein [Gaiellaceae bacterium]|nr:trypsin-like peptidase domain-containing protein [Gaiellaceae bacterium]
MSASPRTAVAALGAAVVLGAAAGAVGVKATDGGPSATPTATSAAQQVASTTGGLSVNDVYDRAGPGVVTITVTTHGSGDSVGPEGFAPGREQQAQGSGFVSDEQGHVVTAAHVVEGADSVSVQLADGSTYDAEVVGSDASTDVAVLKIDAPASKLHPLELADSAAVEVGDGVVAIGAPFGLEDSVTSGIVSALGRDITSPDGFTLTGAIQTDAAINHGNSGGPLLDDAGRVIGVAVQIESDSGGNDGVGFAVPSNTVQSVVRQLLEHGSVEHAYLGVALGTAEQGGAAIARVTSGSPADDAGLQAGDVVTAVDGTSVESSADLVSAVAAKQPGDTVTLTVRRDGGSRSVDVTLGNRPA